MPKGSRVVDHGEGLVDPLAGLTADDVVAGARSQHFGAVPALARLGDWPLHHGADARTVIWLGTLSFVSALCASCFRCHSPNLRRL